MSRPRFSRFVHVAALTAVLLFAQGIAARHVDLDDAHPAGEICAICVAHAHMGSANVATPAVFVVDVQLPVAVDFVPAPAARERVHSRLARGPPH